MRSKAAFVIVLAVALVLGGQSILASHDTNTIHACVARESGTVRIVDSPEDCRPSETATAWNVVGPAGPEGPQGPEGPEGPQGPQGDPGVFSGTFTSDNGAYSISVTDTGIVLSGPSSSITLANGNIEVDGFSVTVKGQTGVSVESSLTTAIKGPLVTLNGSCVGVARVGDVTIGTSGPGFAQTNIVTGSTTVLTC